MKAQLNIISRRFSPVNPILVILSLICLMSAGCGFQLNRNRAQLPSDASTISIEKVNNRSYIAGLDITMRESLADMFQRNSITVAGRSVADLSISVDILSASNGRNTYAYDDSGVEIYEFTFTTKGRIYLTRNVDNSSVYASPPVISGSYSIKTEKEDLTRDEINEGQTGSVENLSEMIIEKLTRDF